MLISGFKVKVGENYNWITKNNVLQYYVTVHYPALAAFLSSKFDDKNAANAG